MKKILQLLLIYLMPLVSIAQTTVPGSGKNIGRIIDEEITFNFKEGTISPKSLPFDVPFIIKGKVPKNFVEVQLTIINKKYLCSGNDCEPECMSCYKKNCKNSIKHNNKHKNQKTEDVEENAEQAPASSRKKDSDCENDCECNECPTKDFRVCQKICLWEITFLNKAEDKETHNTFSMAIPPLKANEKYQFFFTFTRSISGERVKLNALMIPIISNVLFNKYKADKTINTSKQQQLQTALRQAVDGYYKNEFIPISFSGGRLDISQIAQFHTLLSTAVVDTKTINPLFREWENSVKSYENEVRDALNYWNDIIGHNMYMKLINQLSALGQPTAEDKKMIEQLTQLNLTTAVRRRIVGGNVNYQQPFVITNEIIDVTESSKLDKYITNITSFLEQTRPIFTYLTRIAGDNNLRRQVFFTAAENTEYNKLITNGNPNSTERATLSTLKSIDNDNQSKIQDFKTKIIALNNALLSVQNKLKDHKPFLDNLKSYFKIIAEGSITSTAIRSLTVLPTTADYVTRTGYYVSLDAGLAYMFYKNRFINELQPYFGVNFHLGPINKQRKYIIFSKCNPLQRLYKNTSVIIGVTVNSLESGDRKNSLGKVSLLTGVGLRILDPVRISGGVVWNKVDNPNPLDSRQTLRAYPYVSLSFDLDVGKYLGKVGNKIFGIN